MLSYSVQIEPKPKPVHVMQRIVGEEAALMADEYANEYVRNFKQAIVTARAIARGELLHSPRVFSLAIGSRALFKKHITAARQWIFVDRGRRAGAKQPPLQAMIPWFLALNIPRAAWFPILRAIARRGIPKKNLQSLAYRNSQPRWRFISQYRSAQIVRRLFSG